MNKCRLCQQLNTALTTVYNNRLKSLAEIVLKLKGFKISLNFNEALAICENCKEGIENVATFWENIPEAKTDNTINAINKLEELDNNKPAVLSKAEHESSSKMMLAEQQEYERELPCTIVETKFEPIKIRIKLPRKRIIKDKSLCTISPTKSVEKRIRNPPKRFENYILKSPTKLISSNKENPAEPNILYESSLENIPPVAIIRLSNGQEIGKLIELKSKGSFFRMRILCQICCQIFSVEKQFQRHLQAHTNNKQLEDCKNFIENYSFYCQLCEKSFVEQYSVRHHFRYAHSEERPFKCQYCEANFKYKFNLSYHMAKHVPKKRFECIFCKKMFLMRYELQIHLRTHTKEKPYKCELCSCAFAHRSNLKTHKKAKHLKNLVNQTANIEKKMCDEKKFVFKPPENLIEKQTEKQQNLNVKNVLNSETARTLGEFAKVLNNDKVETSSSVTENSFIYISEPQLAGNNNNKLVKLSSKADESYKESLNISPKLGRFQLDSSILKVLPSATLLALKKWPKSYQVTTPSNPSANSTFLNDENSRQHKIVYTSEIGNSGKQGNYFLNDQEPENSSKNITNPIKSVISYRPLHETFLIGPEINSTQVTNNISFKILNSSHSDENSNDDSLPNLKTTNFEVSKGGKFINISKLSKSSTGLNGEQLSGTEHVQNKHNINLTTQKDMLNLQPYNNLIKREEASQELKVVKISTKPVKIKNILNLKTPVTNNSISNTTSDYIIQISNRAITNYNKDSSERKLNCSTNAPELSSSPKCNIVTQSLLKPTLKRKQATTLSPTNIIENQAILPCKPLITNVEILPSLKIRPTMQKSIFPSAPISLMKTPIDYKHQCPYCYKYFKQKSCLTKHTRTHTGEKPYKCNLCPKSYADASNYKKHKILHKNAAEALNITGCSNQAIQNSPAYSAVSDPDPDGIEVMQSIKKFKAFTTEDEDDVDVDDDDDVSLTSSTVESHMWHEALEHALKNNDIRESFKRNFADINSAIMPKSVKQLATSINLNKSFSTEDPD